MKSAKFWHSAFNYIVVFALTMIIAGIIIPSPYDNLPKLIGKWAFYVGFITLILSVLHYYGYLMERTRMRQYRVTWTYWQCARDIDGNKVKTKKLFTGTLTSTVEEYGRDHNLLSGKQLANYLYQNRRSDLCNGQISVDSVEYLGDKFTN